MTLQQLRYVTTVAETGTMSEAARRLFVSQPGLTKAIRELEQEISFLTGRIRESKCQRMERYF